MKHLAIIMLLISLSSTNDITHTAGKEKKKDSHQTQKKQFVNFINDDGEYARNYVDLTNNESDGFGDMFRGRGNTAAVMGGGMQLTENSLGGLSLDGDNMDGAYNQLGVSTNAFSSFEDNNDVGDQRTAVHIFPALRSNRLRRLFICRANSDLPWMKLKLRCASSTMGQAISPDVYSNDGYGYNTPGFFGSFDVNAPSQDILSPFYNSESKLEDNINLSDTIGNSNQLDVNSFNDALQGLNHGGNINRFPQLMKAPSKMQTQKAGANSDAFNSELGDIESSDEKLQKLLESSIGNNNGNNNGNSNGDDASTATATVGSFLSALLSQQGNGNGLHPQHIGQTQGQDDNTGGGYDGNQQQMQQNALNQLSGTMAQDEMSMQRPVTVHVHASDKPTGHKNISPPLPEESRAVAQQAQDIAMKQHKAKLAKLKKRLALLREKLTELEDEQSKKSTKNNDPKETRKDAIKRILIKNLKLATIIATKEIEMEESKSHEFENMSRRKEDDAITHGSSKEDDSFSKLSSSKPLTELSKKAEDEVNHLTNIGRPRLNTTLNRNSLARHNDTLRDTKVVIDKSTLNRTKENLDDNRSKNQEHAVTTRGVFLKKLQTQIRSMSLDQAHMVKENGKRSLRNVVKRSKRLNKSERNLRSINIEVLPSDRIKT